MNFGFVEKPMESELRIICRILRKSVSKNKYIPMKKSINYDVHKLNVNFLHIQMQKIFEKKNCSIIFITLGLVIFFFSAVGHRTPHRAFKSFLKYMYLG